MVKNCRFFFPYCSFLAALEIQRNYPFYGSNRKGTCSHVNRFTKIAQYFKSEYKPRTATQVVFSSRHQQEFAMWLFTEQNRIKFWESQRGNSNCFHSMIMQERNKNNFQYKNTCVLTCDVFGFFSFYTDAVPSTSHFSHQSR